MLPQGLRWEMLSDTYHLFVIRNPVRALTNKRQFVVDAFQFPFSGTKTASMLVHLLAVWYVDNVVRCAETSAPGRVS